MVNLFVTLPIVNKIFHLRVCRRGSNYGIKLTRGSVSYICKRFSNALMYKWIQKITVDWICIFRHSHWIRRDTLYLSVFSPNAGKKETRITPNTDTFHAVEAIARRSSIEKVFFKILQNSRDTTFAGVFSFHKVAGWRPTTLL